MATPESLGDFDNFTPKNGRELADLVHALPGMFENLATVIGKIFEIAGESVAMPESVGDALFELLGTLRSTNVSEAQELASAFRREFAFWLEDAN